MKAISNQVRSTLESKIYDLEERVNEWKSRTRNLRKDTMRCTLEEFAELKNNLEIYQESLQMKSDDLLGQLTTIEDMANDIVLDQATKARGVSGSAISRWKEIMEDNGGLGQEDYTLGFDNLKKFNLPACYFDRRFYNSTGNSSGYRALLHMGYIGTIDTDIEVVVLSKITS